jgi:hypothetical protein
MNLPTDLQRSIAQTRAIIRYRYPWWLRAVLLPGVAGVTLGRRIYLAEGDGDLVRSLRHELVHVRQIARVGLFTFYWRWVGEYVANRRRGLTSDESYRRISFEEEAFAEENI